MISCRRWSGAKSPIDGNAIYQLEKRTTDAKKLSFMSLHNWLVCAYQSGIFGIFSWASDFFGTWASSGTIYYRLQKDANVNNPANTFVRLVLQSVLGLGLTLGSYKVYHTAGRMLILHRYRTPVAVCIASFPLGLNT